MSGQKIHQIIYFLDFVICYRINSYFKGRNDLKMIEIGSYMEIIIIVARNVQEIHCIEPFRNMKILMMISDILGMIKRKV